MQENDLNHLEQQFRQLNDDLRRLTQQQNTQSSSNKKQESGWQKLGSAISKTGDEFKETLEIIKSGNGQLSNYSRFVDQASNLANKSLTNFGSLGKAASIAIAAFAFLAKRFLNSSDKFIQAHDSLAKYGATIEQTPSQLMEQAHSTRMFYSETLEKYTQSLETLGTSSLFMGKTVAQGFNEFSKLSSVSSGVIQMFNALGVEPGKLTKHFADYIKLQSRSGFEQYSGTIREQNRAINFTKNLFAMSALTGESVDSMYQRYYQLRNDVQFNARMAVLRSKGKAKQAENIEATLAMIGSVMGDDAAKAYKDIITNGFSTLDETKGEIVSSGGKIFQMAQRSLEDDTYDATKVLTDMLKYKGDWIKTMEPVLRAGDNEVAKMIGVTAQQFKAVKTHEAGATIEDVIADRKKDENQASMLKDTQYQQTQMETKAGMATDKMANALSGEAVTVMDTLYTVVKFAAKTFAYGAGLFGKKDLQDEINRLFDTPDETKRAILKGESELDTITKQLKEKQSKLREQTDELDKLRDMEKRGEITHEQRMRLSKLTIEVMQYESDIEKLKSSQTQISRTLQGDREQYAASAEAIEGDTQIAKIANVIGKYESDAAGGYRAITRVGDAFKAATPEQRQYMENFLATIETHTIEEVMAFQKWMLKSIAGKNINTAIGRFQMIPSTLAAVVAKGEKRGEVSRTDKFTPSTQNKLLKVLLDDIGYQKFLAGKMTKEQFTARIAGTWAGIAKNELGQGVYDGKHGNQAGKKSFSDMVSALSSSEQPKKPEPLTDEQSKKEKKPEPVVVKKQESVVLSDSKKPSEQTLIKKFAIGGISTDPIAELHGVEGVVPLNENKKIDVDFQPLISQLETTPDIPKLQTIYKEEISDTPTTPIQQSNNRPSSINLNTLNSKIKQILFTMSLSSDYLERALVHSRM